MAVLSLSFLGPLILRTDNGPLALPATQKACSLLAYLVLHRDHAYPREQLADLLWPDRPRDKALHNLSTALWHIRRVLPTENYLLADAHTLQFDPASTYWLDVQEFECNLHPTRSPQPTKTEDQSLASGLSSLAACIKLYRGDLLEGFYDDWCLEERYRLEGLYLNALDQLVTGYQSLKHFEETLQYARLLLAHDPLREDIHCTIIRLQVELGNQAEALHQARWCRAVLKAESNAEVAPETAALWDELFGSAWRYEPGVETIAHPDAPRAEKVLALERPPLVGREHEWGELRAHWEKAQSQQGHMILVKGEAGIGKSRLAQEMTGYVRQSGGWVASGHCYEYERAMPYGLLVDLLRGTLSITRSSLEHLSPWQMTELARLAPELEAPPASARFLPIDQEQARLFDALLFFLFDLARQNPLLLIMEDLHWANESTLAWLHYLARRLSEVPILLFATCRCEEVSADHPLQKLVLQLEQQGLASELELARLSQGDLARWMENASATLVAQVYQRTAGNPFFILETLRALCEDGQAQLLDGRWVETGSAFDLPIPASVSQAVQLHLDRLSPQTRKVAALAAVMGRTFDYDVLTQAWEQGEETMLEALDELLRRRLIREAGGLSSQDYEFDHQLVQEVLYQGLHHRQRRRLHRLVGEALESIVSRSNSTDRAGELAFHFEQAQAWPRAVHYLLQAGHAAAALYAHDEAVAYWQRALTFFDRLSPSEAAALREAMGSALIARAELFHLRGHATERQADLHRLQQLARETSDEWLLDRALIREARYLNLDGRYAQAIEQARAVATRCRQRHDDDNESQALAEWGFGHYFRGEYQQAMEPLQAALALEQITPSTRTEVLSVLSYAYYLIADYERSLDYRQQTILIREALGNKAHLSEDLTDMGILQTRLNRLPQAEEYLALALRLARETGALPAESYALNNLGNFHYLCGDYSQALQRYTDSLTLQQVTGSRRGEGSAWSNLGMIRIALGDYGSAEQALQQALAIQEEINYESGLSETLSYLALARTELNGFAEAVEAATRALEIARQINDRYCQVLALNVLGRVWLNANEPAQAIARLDESIALAQAPGLASGYIMGLSLMGLAQLALGNSQAASQHSQRAMMLLRQQEYIEGPEEQIYWVHHRIMAALGQQEEANTALLQARAEIMRKAGKLTDESLRHCFLAKVSINRQIVAADAARSA